MGIAVFASGNGSNFEALVRDSRRRNWPLPIRLLVTDKENCGALERAKRLDVPAFSFDPKQYASKEEYEREILTLLQEQEIQWIALAGYMRIIGSTLLQAYPWRIVNVHPSLLPAFPGKDAVGQALKYGVKWTGATIHFVDEGIDTGPIIAQKPVLVHEGDDHTTLTKRIQFLEHHLYPATLRQLIMGKIPLPSTTFLQKRGKEM